MREKETPAPGFDGSLRALYCFTQAQAERVLTELDAELLMKPSHVAGPLRPSAEREEGLRSTRRLAIQQAA